MSNSAGVTQKLAFFDLPKRSIAFGTGIGRRSSLGIDLLVAVLVFHGAFRHGNDLSFLDLLLPQPAQQLGNLVNWSDVVHSRGGYRALRHTRNQRVVGVLHHGQSTGVLDAVQSGTAIVQVSREHNSDHPRSIRSSGGTEQ